jgi:hypothetical protein
MRFAKALRLACLVGGGCLMLVACWALLWIFSSYSLAFVACDGQFSMFAENARCRQPQLAMLLLCFSVGGAIGLAILARRFR